MKTIRVAEEHTATAREVRTTRADMDPPRPWHRPDPGPYLRLATVGAEVLDAHALRLFYWPAGVAFVLDPEGPHRTVLSLPAARDLADAILGHLAAVCDEPTGPPPPGRWADRSGADDETSDER